MDWRVRQAGLRVGGHRGSSALAPENTYASFEQCIRDGGLYTETDVRASSDGAMVLVHDDTLDRTTSLRGPVVARTAEELARADAIATGLRAFEDRRWERCRMVVENSVRLGEIEISGGDPAEHGRIMRESMTALPGRARLGDAQ